MANKPNMGYSSAQANEMLMGLPGAMATETGRMLKATKTGLGNWWDSLDDTSKVAAGLSVTPVGDIAGLANDARLFYQNPEMRTPANFGLSALGLLPLIPSMGMVKGVGKGMDVPAINDIRPPKENLSTVTSSLSNNAKVIGDETVNIDSLQGGVGQEVNDIKRVDDLAKKLSTKGSYIERLIVDDAGNVIEGQHRLDALRKLGVKEVPIVRIKDYMRDFPNDVKDTIRSAQKMPSDQVNQLESMLAEIYAQENGNISEIMKYDVPKGYEDAWSAAINVLKRNDMTAQESKGLVPPVQRVAPSGLVVANKYEKGIIQGKPGDLHFSVHNDPQSKKMGELLATGFADSQGNFYDRNQALEFVRQSNPDQIGMQDYLKRASGLDAKDYNATTGVGITDAIPEARKYNIVPPVQRIAPQDEALRLAQERAALQGQSDDPYARSLQQGFDHDWYHGTTGDITNFRTDLLGEVTGAESAKKGFFFARDPQNPPTAMLQKTNDQSSIDMLKKMGMPDEKIAELNSVSMQGHGAETASGYAQIGGSREYREATRKAKSAEKRKDWDENEKQLQIAEDAEINRMNYMQSLTAKHNDSRDEMLDTIQKTVFKKPLPQTESVLLDEKYKQLFPNGWYNFYNNSQFNNAKKQLVNMVGEKDAIPALQKIDKYQSILNERRLAENTQEGSNVMPVALSYKNPLVHDFGGSAYREQTYSDLMDEALANKHDALILKNTFDPGAGEAKLVDVGVVFDPDQIRSRFAAFDPFRRSAAIAAAMGVAAPDLMADEKQKPAKKNIVPPVKKQGK
jgi:hypothetical protein